MSAADDYHPRHDAVVKEEHHHATDDDLMNQIFSVVTLPEVHYHEQQKVVEHHAAVSEALTTLDDAIGDQQHHHHSSDDDHQSTNPMIFLVTDDDENKKSKGKVVRSTSSSSSSSAESDDVDSNSEVVKEGTYMINTKDGSGEEEDESDVESEEGHHHHHQHHEEVVVVHTEPQAKQHHQMAHTVIPTPPIVATAEIHHHHHNEPVAKPTTTTASAPAPPIHHVDTTHHHHVDTTHHHHVDNTQYHHHHQQQLNGTGHPSTLKLHHHHHETPSDKPDWSRAYYEADEKVEVSAIAGRMLAASKQLKSATQTAKAIYLIDRQPVAAFQSSIIRKFIIGGEQHTPTDDNKVVLLFGRVGAGKTSVVNSILNYLYDVKKENNFRFAIEDNAGGYVPTNALTAYVFNNTILPYAVTVVDTPGIVETAANAQGVKIVAALIKQWLELELRTSGFRLDALSVVLRDNEDQLSWSFIAELTAVRKLLGDDLKTNVLPIVTHAEVLPQPTAVHALTAANITFVDYYKLNNSAFFSAQSGRVKQQLYYSHAEATFERYFNDLHNLVAPLVAVPRNSPTSPTGGKDLSLLY